MSTLPKMSITRRLKAVFFGDKFAFRHTENSHSSNKRKKKKDGTSHKHQLEWCAILKDRDVYLRIVSHCQKKRFDVRT